MWLGGNIVEQISSWICFVALLFGVLVTFLGNNMHIYTHRVLKFTVTVARVHHKLLKLMTFISMSSLLCTGQTCVVSTHKGPVIIETSERAIANIANLGAAILVSVG